MNKKIYLKPELKLVALDYTFSLQMASQPKDKPPRPPRPQGASQQDSPFASPFGDDTFK